MDVAARPVVSIVVPVYQERENVTILYDEVVESMRAASLSFELIFVDDGSTDGTVEQLGQLARDERVKLVLFRRNYGQTAAMQAGIDHATGDYIVTMDGDLQNDPREIPMMIRHLDQGYDLVHGWRRRRQDKWLSRKLPSRIANKLISRATGFPIHDLGCTLKVMRREVARDLELYGDMHRFIPILADRVGARCLEVETNHRARKFGQTKYGIGRTFRVVLDLITVCYMQRYFSKPMRLFGAIGLWMALFALLGLTATAAMKLGWNQDMTGNPMLILSMILAVMSVQFFSLGLIGEVSARIYFGQRDHCSYHVRRLVNFDRAHTLPNPHEQDSHRDHRRAA